MLTCLWPSGLKATVPSMSEDGGGGGGDHIWAGLVTSLRPPPASTHYSRSHAHCQQFGSPQHHHHRPQTQEMEVIGFLSRSRIIISWRCTTRDERIKSGQTITWAVVHQMNTLVLSSKGDKRGCVKLFNYKDLHHWLMIKKISLI